MERRFEIIKKYQNQEINIPTRQTLNSAGYDIESAITISINPNQIVLVPTGIKVYLNNDEVLLLISRSSLSKKGLMIPNGLGVIDSDYVDNDINEGEIFMQLYNFSSEEKIINKGDRIGQCIIVNFLKTKPDNVKTNVRKGGFGSSGN